MSKSAKIIYWISTIWLALGMSSTGIVQLFRVKEEVESMEHLGYPAYFLTILGIWKILGVIALLIPKFPLLKEWAYAGFFFAMSGAAISHIILGDGIIMPLPLMKSLFSFHQRKAKKGEICGRANWISKAKKA